MLSKVLSKVVTTFSTKSFQGHAFGAPDRLVLAKLCGGAASTRRDALNDRGECRAVSSQGSGEFRRSWCGSLARCLLRDSAPARAAARTAVTPAPATRRYAPE